MAALGVVLNDYGKLIIAVTLIVCGMFMAVFGHMDPDDVRSMWGLIIGYTVGNGVSAVKRQPSQPMLAPALVATGPGTNHPEHPARNGGVVIGDHGPKGDKGDKGDPGAVPDR